ncbi:hypothetical protein ABW20_dc0100527 [Dactylellina cionopaga]|nr:hypothetical protein ABW20_dc0100527 [Dactylellina cionopaga]
MLDQIHLDIPDPKPPNDHNEYILGSIGKHNIAIACLPFGMVGTNQAATAATRMLSTFPLIKVGLMVGIGGGIPPKVKLGDIVVSTPVGHYPGVVQWDFGKAEEDGFKRTGALNNPPTALLTALTKLVTKHKIQGAKIHEKLETLQKDFPALVDSAEIKPEVRVHYGLIASGNQVVKDAKVRDSLDESLGGNVLCIEMEAAGLMDFPCIVIRGICDYADSHKNKDWQEYAAAVAAAYAKELLECVQPNDVDRERPLRDILGQVQNDIAEMVSRLDRKEDLEILNWLTPIDYGPQHSDLFNRRQPGTGKWFLKHERYHEWLNKGGILFCPGIPGAGKTILASIVIDDLTTRLFETQKIGIAYIYCNFRRRGEQKFDDLLTSLLKQLLQTFPSPGLPECVESLYKRHNSRRTRPPSDDIINSLEYAAQKYSRVFIIVDALDECICQAELLSMLFRLRFKCNVNIFATSRFIPEVTDIFEREKSVTLEIFAQDEDIRDYLDGQLAKSEKALLRKNGEFIKSEIMKVVRGM